MIVSRDTHTCLGNHSGTMLSILSRRFIAWRAGSYTKVSKLGGIPWGNNKTVQFKAVDYFTTFLIGSKVIIQVSGKRKQGMVSTTMATGGAEARTGSSFRKGIRGVDNYLSETSRPRIRARLGRLSWLFGDEWWTRETWVGNAWGTVSL